MSEREIFLAVLDLPDVAARTDYLDTVCAGDTSRRARIDSLLWSHDTAASFLDRPAVTPPDLDSMLTQDEDHPATPEPEHEADADLDFLQPPTRPDSLGRIGHYEVLQVLGRGGFGIVLRAFDEMLHRVVAVKVLAPQLAAAPPARKRFVREARSSAKVRHENVVQVYAVEERPLPYLVMEFIPGETVQQRLNRTGPLEAVEAARIGRQIAEGLAAAHATGLIHRDIKPTNILIEAGPKQCVKITDFGLARATDDASASQSGFIAGSPLFMSPEQVKGEALDHRTDLFSLGSLLYTICSGRSPFRAFGTLAILKRVTEDTPRPITEINPEVPRRLGAIIDRLHCKQPQDRFATARDVADELGQFLDEMLHPAKVAKLPDVSPAAVATRPPIARMPAAASAIRPPRWRNRGWKTALIALALFVGGLGFTEASGVTHFRGTVIRLFRPEGTLVIEIDDPEISVKVVGSEIVITGAGARAIQLTPGRYTVEASKHGNVVSRELVTVTKDDRRVVRVSQEAPPAEPAQGAGDALAWEQSVAAMPAVEQVKSVAARLKELNPGFDGAVTPIVREGVVTGLQFLPEEVSDLTPVRALKGLASLICKSRDLRPTKLVDLSPLRGMSLRQLNCEGTEVWDLTPLAGMPLTWLSVWNTKVSDLSPLKGMPLTHVRFGQTNVSDLSPLTGAPPVDIWCPATQVADLRPLADMRLTFLDIRGTPVTDLAPLKGMPLQTLWIGGLVTDLSPLQGMPLVSFALSNIKVERDERILRAIPTLEILNSKPVAEFWKAMEAAAKEELP